MPILTLHLKSEKALPEIAGQLSALFSVDKFRMHESENYSGGVYFAGDSSTTRITLALEDHVGFGDYNYELYFEPLKRGPVKTDADVEHVVQKLFNVSSEIARGLEHKTTHVVRLIYSRRAPDSINKRKERISLT